MKDFSEKKSSISANTPDIHQTLKEDFISLVNKGIAEIECSFFQKVVLSRTKQLVLPADFDVVAIFNKLCKAYPTAFVSVVSLPHLGIVWMGASPRHWSAKTPTEFSVQWLWLVRNQHSILMVI